MIDLDLAMAVAAEVERSSGLPCGVCGGRHVRSAEELEREDNPCMCRCCSSAFAACFEADFPDLVSHQGGRRVISEAAVEEAIRRLESQIATGPGAGDDAKLARSA